MKQADVVDLRRGHGGPAAGPGAGAGRAQDGGGRRRRRPPRAGRPIRRPGLGAGLCQVRMLTALGVWDASGSRTPSRSAKSWSPTARPASRPRLSRCISMPQEVGADGAGPYRREPPYPRRAVCGGGAAAESGIDRAGRGDDRWRSKRAAPWRPLANGEQIRAALAIAADGREFAAARRRWASA